MSEKPVKYVWILDYGSPIPFENKKYALEYCRLLSESSVMNDSYETIIQHLHHKKIINEIPEWIFPDNLVIKQK